jgi:saccharopine dehydrogenase-like NADP-dependent oxidoreductase
VRALVIGSGAVGGRVARALSQLAEVDEVVVGRELTAIKRADVVILASPSNHHPEPAAQAIRAGAHVVSTADGVDAVRDLLELDAEARERGRTIAVGAGFSPGLSCVLARHAASTLDSVDEVHVSRIGTGGPACARQHHAALGGTTLDWRDHGWHRRPAGSGRELCWFPDPIGAADCYRASLPDALLLVPAFPGAARITARMAATRRDRLTTWLPMLRRPHPEGGLGAARVEVRGVRSGASETEVLGAIDRPAAAAATVAGLVARWASAGRLARAGAAGLAELVDPLPFLHELARLGVKAAVFEGTA